MLVSKHAAELCAHLVNDFFGELPARVLAMLFSKGKMTVAQLTQHTSLSPRQVRHGLAVLLQQNLLFYETSSVSSIAGYEANPDACYGLVRSGRIVGMIGNEYGTAEQDVFQTLLQLGHARISDLVQAFGFSDHENGNIITNGHSSNEEDFFAKTGHIGSRQEFHAILARLVMAEVIDQVGPKTFRDPDDVYREIEQDVTKVVPGEKAVKNKTEQQRKIVTQFVAARDEGKKLKRQLDQTVPFAGKRRRLTGGGSAHGSLETHGFPELDPNLVLRVNFEKCFVDLRNQTLSQYAADSLGEITGQVYHTALRLVSEKIPRCRADPRVEVEAGDMHDEDDDSDDPRKQIPRTSITALQIFEALDPSLNVAAGLGKATKDKLDFRSAEKIRAAPAKPSLDSDESDDDMHVGNGMRPGGASEEDNSEDDDHEAAKRRDNHYGKVKFEGGADTNESRFDHMRHHLLLLAESQQGFLRHCGTQGRGQFTVDFKLLMNNLRRTEVDAVIEQKFGRHGLRLTRILRRKGKLDEKTLPSMALMKKGDVQGKMLGLQMAGFVDVQEVPRDNSRTANRTMFFWFFDEDRVSKQLLDDVYKAMLRGLQTLEVQRYRERNILSFVERRDVRGKEEEVMTAEHYDKYSQFLELQSKLLGHVTRLDDLVAVLKDF